MLILGLSFGFHDSAVAIIKDGKILFAALEERFTRKKHDNSFPINAIKEGLTYLNLKIENIDYIVYYEDNLLKFDRILWASQKCCKSDYFSKVFDFWIKNNDFNIKNKISTILNFDENRIVSLNHHLSHAASAYFPSGFDRAAILTIDAVGEYETLTIYKGEKNNLIKLFNKKLPDSIGLFYSAYTAFLGFEVNEGEYKVMGMSAYGTPIYTDKILQTIKLDYENKDFKINQEFFDFLTPKDKLYKEKFVDLLGEPRDIEAPFFTDKFIKYAPHNLTRKEKKILAEKNQYYADIAASLQKVTEDLILMFVEKSIKLTNCKNVCLAGGVALNSLANGQIRKLENINKIFIQPAAGDSGAAIGCALYWYYKLNPKTKKFKLISAFLGKNFTRREIKITINENLFEEDVEYIEDKKKFIDKVTDLLIEKNVIGWFYHKYEFGPRALGARSIIADPRYKEMKNIVNEKIKFRELFRPFAPSVLYEYAHEWFELVSEIPENAPENFMLTVVNVKKEKQKYIPAVLHVDNTSRVQIVRNNINPLYYNLILNFYFKTGVPLILNTSFNLKGEPIVRTPKDAILTFSYCDMDYLVMYPYIIKNFWKD